MALPVGVVPDRNEAACLCSRPGPRLADAVMRAAAGSRSAGGFHSPPDAPVDARRL